MIEGGASIWFFIVVIVDGCSVFQSDLWHVCAAASTGVLDRREILVARILTVTAACVRQSCG